MISRQIELLFAVSELLHPDRGLMNERLQVAQSLLKMVAEIELTERAKVAQVPSDMDDNCG